MSEKPWFEITYQRLEGNYSLRVNGIKVGTGDMHELVSECEKFRAKAKCTLFPDAFSPTEPAKMPRECIGKDCTKCGWNPDVADKRLKKAGLK